MDSNFRFPDAPSGRSAEARTFSSDREFAPLAWRDRDFELRPLAGWISALERGRFQGHKQKRKHKSVAPFARNRKFESISLQRRVLCEPGSELRGLCLDPAQHQMPALRQRNDPGSAA